MADTALQHQLTRIQILLVLTVSFLSGLVFGRDYGGEAFYAVVSFAGLSVILLAISKFQSTTSE